MIVNRDPGDESGYIDPFARIQEHAKAFEAFHEQIKDIDWYKAEAEAARNGQVAAEQYAAMWKEQWIAEKVAAENNNNYLMFVICIISLIVIIEGIVLVFT